MTPGYSPPEQYGTARTDPRTDIYSLGATLYAALSGIIPEDGLARAMDNTQLTPLRKRNSKVSRRFAASIEKAMGIDPADRFQNAEEFKRSLLGSKTKTQLLPGDFMVEPSTSGCHGGTPAECDRESLKPGGLQIGKWKRGGAGRGVARFQTSPQKTKGPPRINNLIVDFAVAIFGNCGCCLVHTAVCSGTMMSLLSPLRNISLPFLPTSQSFTAVPPATETSLPLPTVTPLAYPTHWYCYVYCHGDTPAHCGSLSPTPGSTLIPVATSVGGGSGQIVFASSRSVVPQLYLVNADGTDLDATHQYG